MELFSHQGEPEDKDLFQQVMQHEDTLEKEMWDLRLGPAIWNRVRNQFPEDTLIEEDKYRLQLILFSHIIQKPAKEFLVLMKEVLSNSEQGKRLLGLLYRAIQEEIRDFDYTETMNQFDKELDDVSDDTDDDDLDDFLGSLGISRPKDE